LYILQEGTVVEEDNANKICLVSVIFCLISVTDQGSVFESRTGQTEDEKLSWLFSGLNCERMSVGYVAELRSHAKMALVWNGATVQF
jgi:hypothetical protein